MITFISVHWFNCIWYNMFMDQWQYTVYLWISDSIHRHILCVVFVISDVNLYIELLITERQYIQTIEVGLYIKRGGKCVCSKKLVHTCQLTDFCRSHNWFWLKVIKCCIFLCYYFFDYLKCLHKNRLIDFWCLMPLSNISAISWRPVLVVE